MILLIEEGKASNAVIVVVDGDRSDVVVLISWQHTGEVSLHAFVSLFTPGTIGHDEVEMLSFTVLLVVLKASKPEVFSLLNGLS